MSLFNWIGNKLIGHARQHPYSHLWHRNGTPYMERFWLIKPRRWLPFSIRIHNTVSSDWDRELHDHPWPSCSVILRGHYIEVMPRHQAQSPSQDMLDGGVRSFIRKPGDVVFRGATDRHRLVIPEGTSCWSMFIMGRKIRQWGFHTTNGWVSRREYSSTNEKIA